MLLIGCFTGLSAVDVEFPLIQSMSYFPYSNHNTLDKKEIRLTYDLAYSNIYMYDFQRTTVNDMETMGNTFSFQYGLSKRLTLEFYFRTVLAYGGMMDKLIVDFHKGFGLAEGGRHDFPRNKVHYSYKDSFSHTGSPIGISPPVAGLLGNIYKKGPFTLNGRLSVGLPIGSKAGFSGKLFVTCGLIFLYQNQEKKISASWANHFSLFGSPKWLKEDVRNNIFHTELRVDYRFLFAGVLFKSTPFRNEDLSNPAWQVYLGFKFLKRFEFSLVEELPPMDTTPDVTFLLRVKIL